MSIMIGLLSQTTFSQYPFEGFDSAVSIYDTNLSGVWTIDDFGSTASFPGGQDSLFCQIENSLNQTLINSYKSPGIVLIEWTIDTAGYVQNVQVNTPSITQNAKHIQWVEDSRILDEFAKAYSQMPSWNPDKKANTKVETLCRQMIKLPYKYRCVE